MVKVDQLVKEVTPNDEAKNHSPDFKAKVALEAIRKEMSMAELSQKYGIHGTDHVKCCAACSATATNAVAIGCAV